jgi:hypothetical protein
MEREGEGKKQNKKEVAQDASIDGRKQMQH